MEENKSNKHLYFPMSREVSLGLISEWVKPDTPTLGMWFGWNQPDKDTTVKLGSIYGTIGERYTFKEILDNCEGLTLEDKKELIREIKSNGCNMRQEYSFDAIYNDEEIFISFDCLEPFERVLYRLHTIVINTMTELHNWSIEYGEYLASEYYDQTDYKILCYIPQEGNDADIALSEILERCDNNPISVHIEERENPIYWYDDKTNPDIIEWLESLQEEKDIIQTMFGENVYLSWELEEIFVILSLAIEWIIDVWNSGDLEFHSSEDITNKTVREWIKGMELQDTLPGF